MHTHCAKKIFQDSIFDKRHRNENPNFLRNLILNDEFLFINYKNLLEKQMSIVKSNFGPESVDNLKIYELGSAGGITSILNPKIRTSDVRLSEGVDFILDACQLSLANDSVDVFISKDVLHHLENVEEHFKEISRVLRSGGISVYIEPNWNILSKIIFFFFHPEPWLSDQIDWKFSSTTPMYSNQALPWIVFRRDAERFRNSFPNLVFEILEPLNGLSYILSGGAFKRNSIPPSLLQTLKNFEVNLPLLLKFVGISRLIVVRKDSL